jgi:hypothetical protein
MNPFDVRLILGHPYPDPAQLTIGVFESHLASEGFCVLIGWDVLSHCRLFCDGPARTFRLEFYRAKQSQMIFRRSFDRNELRPNGHGPIAAIKAIFFSRAGRHGSIGLYLTW